MKTEISDAQLEIWEAKEKLYEELKDIPLSKRVEYLQKKAKNAMDKFFKSELPRSRAARHQNNRN